jgi:hypothetical protein
MPSNAKNRIKKAIRKSAIRNHIPPNLGGKPREEPSNLKVIKSKLSKNSLTELSLGFEEVDFYNKRDVQSLIKVIREQFWQRVIVDKASPLKTIKIGWRLPKFAVGPVLQQVIPMLLQEPIRVTSIQLILNAWAPEDCLRKIVSWHTLEVLDLRSVSVRCPLLPPLSTTTTVSSQHSHGCLHHNIKNRHGSSPASTANGTGGGYVDTSTFAMLNVGGDDTTSTIHTGTTNSTSMSSFANANSSSSSHHHYHNHHNHHTSPTLSASSVATATASTGSSLSSINSGFWTEERNIICMVPYMSTNIQTLKLVDCGIHQGHIPELCQHLRRRRHLQYLSLRQNRNLDGDFTPLFQLPYVRVIDLSLCDLDRHDGDEIKRALANAQTICSASSISGKESTTATTSTIGQKQQRRLQLQKLILAGNYRLSASVPALVEVAADRLVELDCSFCDVQGKLQNQVFTTLAETNGCTLRSFYMQGTRIVEMKGLVNCIKNNSSLRRLVIDHPREPFPIQTSGVEQIAKALEWNYYLQDLKVDTLKRLPTRVQKDMDFWLTLNQCGRAAVLDETEINKPWAIILAEAAKKDDDPTLLYWLLKHGSASFCASA